MRRRGSDSSRAGFSLIEAIAALALTATTIMALGSVAGQWMPNWSRGFIRLQSVDSLGVGVERIGADISAAQYAPSASSSRPRFEGSPSSVVFVRSAIGPNAYPHLEFVRFAEVEDDRGVALVRTTASFVPTDGAEMEAAFVDPVVLVRAPYRISFAYAGAGDRTWRPEWRGRDRLPDAVRVTVQDASGAPLPWSTAIRLKVTASGATKEGGAPAPAVKGPPPRPKG